MLLILHRSDLNKMGQDLPLIDIEVHHKRGDMRDILRANMVMFYDHKTDAIKILKNRFGNNFTQFSEKTNGVLVE